MKDDQKERWETPAIRVLSRLGERTAPTTTSASSPEMFTPNISEIEELIGRDKEDK